MQPSLPRRRRRSDGFSLVIVLVFTAVGFLMLSSILFWSATSGQLTERNNEFYGSLAAAEAATEKVIARLAQDFHTGGPDTVAANLAVYRTLIPNEVTDWQDYDFFDPSGTADRVAVDALTAWQYSPLAWKHAGLSAYNATYRVIANARTVGGWAGIETALRQDVQIAAVPVFSFALFYNLDMELHPWHAWTVGGLVHGNGTNYFKPDSATLTFQDSVTTSHRIVHDDHPEDPEFRVLGTVNYQRYADSKSPSLSLPLGTNNSTVGRAILEIPPSAESATSLLGRQRYYNKADLIVRVDDSGVIAVSGIYNSMAVSVPPATWLQFLGTNRWFYDKREERTVLATDFDVAGFVSEYSTLETQLGRAPKVVYIVDERSQTPGVTIPGIRVLNGSALPAGGLTLASPDPVYVKGPYNTVSPRPASVAGDAVTLLSSNWKTDNGHGNGTVYEGTGRPAVSTTYNLGIITGIVPTAGGESSGGVINAVRLLENWSGDTLTLNGSLAVLFASQVAAETWQNASGNSYAAPTRIFSFDAGYLTQAGLPPGSPELYTMIRSRWEVIPPRTTP